MVGKEITVDKDKMMGIQRGYLVTIAILVFTVVLMLYYFGLSSMYAKKIANQDQLINHQEKTIRDWQGICALPLTKGEDDE